MNTINSASFCEDTVETDAYVLYISYKEIIIIPTNNSISNFDRSFSNDNFMLGFYKMDTIPINESTLVFKSLKLREVKKKLNRTYNVIKIAAAHIKIVEYSNARRYTRKYAEYHASSYEFYLPELSNDYYRVVYDNRPVDIIQVMPLADRNM